MTSQIGTLCALVRWRTLNVSRSRLIPSEASFDHIDSQSRDSFPLRAGPAFHHGAIDTGCATGCASEALTAARGTASRADTLDEDVEHAGSSGLLHGLYNHGDAARGCIRFERGTAQQQRSAQPLAGGFGSNGKVRVGQFAQS